MRRSLARLIHRVAFALHGDPIAYNIRVPRHYCPAPPILDGAQAAVDRDLLDEVARYLYASGEDHLREAVLVALDRDALRRTADMLRRDR